MTPYQEENCEQTFAVWQTWGGWSSCQDENGDKIEFGKGDRNRERGCNAVIRLENGQSETIEFEKLNNGDWAPTDSNRWKVITGNDFVAADCHCDGEYSFYRTILRSSNHNGIVGHWEPYF